MRRLRAWGLLFLLALTSAGRVGAAPTMTAEGVFRVLWGDPGPAYTGSGALVFYGLNQNGNLRTLAVPDAVLQAAGGAVRLDGCRVIVEHVADAPAVRQPLQVVAIRLQDAAEPLHVPQPMVGPQPYLWILVKFQDLPWPDEDEQWFLDRIFGPSPSIDNYYTETSFGNMSLTGSEVLPWGYVMISQEPSHYLYLEIKTNGTKVVTNELCSLDSLMSNVVSWAGIYVDFTNYAGFNMCFNSDLNNVAVGARVDLWQKGVTKEYGVTWLPQWFWGRQASVVHEMGHSFGLHHTCGPSISATNDWPYDSNWDVMSASGAFRWGRKTQDQIAQGMIAYDKDLLGWIGSGARYTAVSNPFVSRVTLANLAAPAPGGTRHLIRLPRFVTAPDEYYTIEKRCFTGYDAILPAETVIMHAVDPALGTCQAQVVDPDFDGDPNDASAQWEPGETFTDTANKLVVTIESEGASSASVVFSNAGRSTTYVDSAAGSTQDGSSTYPWNTAFEGSGAVYPSGTVYIKPGTYGETMEFVKPMLLRGWGAGNVVIGE